MKNSRQSPIFSPAEDVGKKTSDKIVETSAPHEWWTDRTTIENNPKIDRWLLAEYEHLISVSKGVVGVKKQGADYNLAHPLASKDRPTDAYHRGQRVIANKTK
jgi:hypothetical protein